MEKVKMICCVFFTKISELTPDIQLQDSKLKYFFIQQGSSVKRTADPFPIDTIGSTQLF